MSPDLWTSTTSPHRPFGVYVWRVPPSRLNFWTMRDVGGLLSPNVPIIEEDGRMLAALIDAGREAATGKNGAS